MENNMFWLNLQAMAEGLMNNPVNDQASAPMNLNLQAMTHGMMSQSRTELPPAPINLNLQAISDRMMSQSRAEQPSAPINLNLHARAEHSSAPINLNENVAGPAEPQGAAIPNRPAKATPTKTKLQNFSPEEDRALVISWIAISTDPIIGTGQKKEAFWQRVTNSYNNKRGMAPERTQKSVKSRWEAIKEHTMKFSSVFYMVHRENPSGMTDADKTTKAADRFASNIGYSFKFLHVWHLLKDEPAWMDIASQSQMAITLQSQKAPEGVGDNNVPNELDGESSLANSKGKRPVGRDTSKQAKKKSSTSCASEEYVSKIHDLTVEKITFMKDVEGSRISKMDQMVKIEEKKLEKLEQYRERQLILEERRLNLSRRKLRYMLKQKKSVSKRKRD